MDNPLEIPESDAPRRDGVEEYHDLEHRLSQASEAQPEARQGEQAPPDNLDLPDEAQPATASTEKGAASRAETGPEKTEVKNFDTETGAPRPPEGWHPGGPEGRR